MFKLSLLLVAILAASATAVEAFPLSEVVLANLEGFSVQCGQDLQKVYTNQAVQATEAKISQDLSGFYGDFSAACQATTFPCATMAGQGHCCSVNGAQVWGAHPDKFADIQTLGEQGSQVVAGAVVGLGQIQTIMTENGPYSTSTSYLAPAYMPTSCFNIDDEVAFNTAASVNCMKSNPQIKSCAMIW